MRSGAVVRALASHQCGPVSNPGVDGIHVCGLSLLLVLVGGFSPCISVFPLLKKKNTSRFHFDVERTDTFRRELLDAPWVKKCQVTSFLPVPNLYPSPSFYSGTGTVPEFQRGYLKKRMCSHGHHFFWLLSQCLKKIFHFML